jgi:hypothetical protein
MRFNDNSSPAVVSDRHGERESPRRFTLSKDEIRILADYHYYEAEKAITRRGDRDCQRRHLARLAVLRAANAK